jgi:myo-inositol 2-dehydrogenase / D-chiro-inositol 1-dehydrogenase
VPPQTRVRVGLIGAGAMGRRHLEVLAGDPRVEIVAVADAVPATARDAAATVGARPCATPANVVDLGAEAAFVTLPNVYHGRVVLDLLARGLHVFSEKPMAITLAEGRRIAEQVIASGRVYQMGFNRRWAPAYRYLRQAIDEGFVVTSAGVIMNDGDMQTPAWYAAPEISGGFMYDTAIHLIDMIAWLIGPIERVAALGRRSCYPDYDDIALLLSCRGGRPAGFTTCGHASWAPPMERVELYGDHALLASEDLDRVRLTTREHPNAAWRHLPSPSDLARWGYVEEDRAFIDACLGISAPPVGAGDALHSIAVLDAAYTSLRRGGEMIPVPAT